MRISLRSRLACVVALLVAGAALLTLGLDRPRTPDVGAQQAEDPALLRELAERLLSFPSAKAEPAKLYPGALPPGAPPELVTPPGGRLVGSAVLPRLAFGDEPPSTTIAVILDAPLSPPDLLSFYQQKLAPTGWNPAPANEFTRSGFLPPASEERARVFCQTTKGPALNVTAAPSAQGQSQVRLNYSAREAYYCAPRSSGITLSDESAIPPLPSPQGVQLVGGSSSEGETFDSDDALAKTALSPAELESFYAQELTAAGWQRRDGKADGPLAWSVWSVPGMDQSRQGFLYVLDGPQTGQRELHVHLAPGSNSTGTLNRVVSLGSPAPPPV